jgi:hypothetical protein
MACQSSMLLPLQVPSGCFMAKGGACFVPTIKRCLPAGVWTWTWVLLSVVDTPTNSSDKK